MVTGFPYDYVIQEACNLYAGGKLCECLLSNIFMQETQYKYGVARLNNFGGVRCLSEETSPHPGKCHKTYGNGFFAKWDTPEEAIYANAELLTRLYLGLSPSQIVYKYALTESCSYHSSVASCFGLSRNEVPQCQG